MKRILTLFVLFTASIALAQQIDASKQLKGTIPSSNFPAAGASLGATKSGACAAGNHADGTYNADGTPHCSADTGGLPTGCSSPGTGQVNCALFGTTGTNGGFAAPEGNGSALNSGSGPGVAAVGSLFPATTTHHWEFNNNNAGLFIVPGVATPATSGNCAKFGSNGYDLVDAGAACGSGGSSWPIDAATPAFSPVAGSYSGTQSVTVSCGGGATVYCSSNGTSLLGSCSSISVASSETLYGRCELAGTIAQSVTAGYTITSGPAFIASTTSVGNGETFSGTINTTGASLLVAVITDGDNTNDPVIVDKCGSTTPCNTWTYLTVEVSGVVRGKIAYVLSPTTSASHSFAVNSAYGSGVYYAFSGATAFDKQAGTTGLGCSSGCNLASITPTNNNSVIIEGISSGGTSAWTIGSGFSTPLVGYNSCCETSGGSYLIQSTAAAVSPAVTVTPGTAIDVVQAVFH